MTWVLVSWYLVVKEGQSFNLKYEELILILLGGLLRLHRLDRRRQDGPLKLQDSVAHIHFAQVAKVVSALVSVGCQRRPQVRTVPSSVDTSVYDFVPSPTFSQPLPSMPRPKILGGNSTGTCGTDSQSARWTPPLPEPSPRSWCPGAGLCSASSHMESRRQRLYSWYLDRRFQGAWCPVLHKTVWTANR